MTKNWIAVNVALLVIAALMGWQLNASIRRFRADNDPARVVPVEDVKKKITADSGLPPAPPPRRLSPADFELISSKNLFAESRSAEEKTEQPQATEAPALTAKPVLVGVVQSGSESLALVVDPSSPDGRRRAQTKRLGDMFQGFAITEITTSRMVLESGARREVIPLYDGSKHPAQGGKTPILATRVVQFGAGGPTAGSAGGIRPVTASPAEGTRPTTAPAVSSRTTARTTQPAVQPAQDTDRATRTSPAAGDAQGRRVTRTPFGDIPDNSQQSPSPAELRDAQGRRIIRTPFGDVVRPDPPPPDR